MFKAVSSRVNFAEMEEAVLGYWQKSDVFKRSIEARKDCPRFVLYEGPPTANGEPYPTSSSGRSPSIATSSAYLSIL